MKQCNEEQVVLWSGKRVDDLPKLGMLNPIGPGHGWRLAWFRLDRWRVLTIPSLRVARPMSHLLAFGGRAAPDRVHGVTPVFA